MEGPLTQARAAADRLTGGPGARLRGQMIASPAAFSLAKDAPQPAEALAEELARRLPLEGTCFSAVEAREGYLNFTLSQGWYRSVEDAALLAEYPVQKMQYPVKLPDYPASIHPFDWRLLTLLGKGNAPGPGLAARQDEANPGWLLRYTVRRLAAFGSEATPSDGYSAAEQALLLTLAVCLDQTAGSLPHARSLLWAAEAVWRVSPQRLPPRTALAACRVLEQGLYSL
ncbi:MAG: hypothetical protein LUG45_04740 [Clostridiales bacterium]|nr:hypothetical protein [Clostridiales bacterium]